MELKSINIKNISSINCDELKIYTDLSESQLFHYYEPSPGLFIAESPMIIERAMDAGYVPESFLVQEQYLDGIHSADDIIKVLERNENVPVYSAPLEEIKKITGYTITRGILAAMRRGVLQNPRKIMEESKRLVILEDVMNPTNMGAIFRSAAALGIEGVLLTKGCTDPLYRRASRVSMGTVFQIPWTYIMDNWHPEGTEPDINDINDTGAAAEHPGIALLHKMGFTVVAMALKDNSVNMKNLNPDKHEKIAFIMGSEGPGLKDSTINACDVTVKIPMYNGVDSLNVAAASAIAFWQIMK